jgi:hypothetical protein
MAFKLHKLDDAAAVLAKAESDLEEAEEEVQRFVHSDEFGKDEGELVTRINDVTFYAARVALARHGFGEDIVDD